MDKCLSNNKNNKYLSHDTKGDKKKKILFVSIFLLLFASVGKGIHHLIYNRNKMMKPHTHTHLYKC